MNNGWIKLHRQIEDNELWFLEPFTRGQAWVDLLLMANHDPKAFHIRGNRVEVQRGQVARAASTFADRWKWSKGKVLSFFEYLEKCQMIDRRISNVIAIITIKKYDQYQVTEPQNEPQNDRRPNDRPNTNKNEKKEKNTYVVRPETESLVEYINELCTEYRIENKVNSKALDVSVARHLATGVHLRVEVRKCLSWLIDHNKKDVTSQRLVNWFERARDIQKRDQNKLMEKNVVKKPSKETSGSVGHFMSSPFAE